MTFRYSIETASGKVLDRTNSHEMARLIAQTQREVLGVSITVVETFPGGSAEVDYYGSPLEAL